MASERFLLYMVLPDYLAQWYSCECQRGDPCPDAVSGGVPVVRVPKGSQESRILQVFLKKRPSDAVEPECANIALVVPSFAGKDPFYYNWLGPYGREKLKEAIRTRFCLQLWDELHTFRNVTSRQDNAIWAFMEAHGIACTETNWNALAKIYQRMRFAYYNRRKTKKSKKSV